MSTEPNTPTPRTDAVHPQHQNLRVAQVVDSRFRKMKTTLDLRDLSEPACLALLRSAGVEVLT